MYIKWQDDFLFCFFSESLDLIFLIKKILSECWYINNFDFHFIAFKSKNSYLKIFKIELFVIRPKVLRNGTMKWRLEQSQLKNCKGYRHECYSNYSPKNGKLKDNSLNFSLKLLFIKR